MSIQLAASSSTELLDRFNAKTFPVFYGVDMHKLMIMTSLVESDGVVHWKQGPNIGLMQIEPQTANGILLDKSFESTLRCIEFGYGVKLKDYNKDAYTNIVMGYVVYIYKLYRSENYISKFGNKVIAGNDDREWLYYKLFYNSLHGKATYKRWKEKEEIWKERYILNME